MSRKESRGRQLMQRKIFFILFLGISLAQLTACQSNAKLDLSASINIGEASIADKPEANIFIILNIRNNSARTWHKNRIKFECRDIKTKNIHTDTQELGQLDKPAMATLYGGEAVPEGNLLYEGTLRGSTPIQSSYLPYCFPTKVSLTNSTGRAEFELNLKDKKWRRTY